MSFSIIFGQAVSTEPMNYLDTMFGYVGNMGVMKCAAGGTANAIVLTPLTNQPTLAAYAAGQFFSFVATANNTGSVTVNIGGVGSIPLLNGNGTALGANAITGGAVTLIGTDGAGNAWVANSTAQLVNVAETNVDTQWTTRVDGPPTVQLMFGSTTNWDLSKGNTFQLVMTANTIMAAPTNGRDAQCGVFYITQDSTGGRTVTWNAAYDWGAVGTPTLSTGASKTDWFGYGQLGSTFHIALVGKGF